MAQLLLRKFQLFGEEAGPVESKALDTTINSAVHFYKKGKKEIEFEGFDAGADYKGFPNFGSIANGTYTDGDSNSRTVTSFYNHLTGQFPSFADALWLAISSNPPDSDATFSKVVIDAVTRTRASVSATGLQGGSRWWRWNSVGGHFGGANPDPFELYVIG